VATDVEEIETTVNAAETTEDEGVAEDGVTDQAADDESADAGTDADADEKGK